MGRRGEQGHDAGLREAKVVRLVSEGEWEGEGSKGYDARLREVRGMREVSEGGWEREGSKGMMWG
jgi:hypothetical protein